MDLALGLATAVLVTRDPDEFAAAVGELVNARPIEHNILGTVLAGRPEGYFLWATEGDEVVGAALRTPPHPLLASEMSTETAGAILDAALDADPGLSGATAFEPVAGELARAWERRTGGAVTSPMGFRVYALDEVIEPARPPGAARLATVAERELLIEWTLAFARDAHVYAGDPAE